MAFLPMSMKEQETYGKKPDGVDGQLVDIGRIGHVGFLAPVGRSREANSGRRLVQFRAACSSPYMAAPSRAALTVMT